MGFLHLNLIKTVVALFIIGLLAFSFEYLYVRKITNRRKRLRTKVMARNLIIISLIVIFAKIWVDGFGHFLALIGFVSAALTITQKENILNLTGWLIIMWRNAFSEGDFIKIGNVSGVVKSLGVFYFTLEEISGNNYSDKTGKIIKVPNFHISTHPFLTYQIENFVFIEEFFYFSFLNDLEKVILIKNEAEADFKKYLQSLEVRFTNDEKREFQRVIKKNKNKNPVIGLKIEQGTLKGYKMYVQCYSLIQDQIEVRDYLHSLILNLKQTNPEVTFSTDFQ